MVRIASPRWYVGDNHRLNLAVNEGLGLPEVRTSLANLGVQAKIGTPQDFAAALAEQVRDWKTVVEATGIKGE